MSIKAAIAPVPAVLVREAISALHPAPSSSPNAFFTILDQRGVRLAADELVRLQIPARTVATEAAPSQLFIIDILIAGPVVDVKKQRDGVVYIVKNLLAPTHTQVAFAYLRAPGAVPPPDASPSADLVRGVGRALSPPGARGEGGRDADPEWEDGTPDTPENPAQALMYAARPKKRLRPRPDGPLSGSADLRAMYNKHAPATPSPLSRGGALEMEE